MNALNQSTTRRLRRHSRRSPCRCAFQPRGMPRHTPGCEAGARRKGGQGASTSLEPRAVVADVTGSERYIIGEQPTTEAKWRTLSMRMMELPGVERVCTLIPRIHELPRNPIHTNRQQRSAPASPASLRPKLARRPRSRSSTRRRLNNQQALHTHRTPTTSQQPCQRPAPGRPRRLPTA